MQESLSCCDCKKSFDSSTSLEHHLLSVHLRWFDYECVYCEDHLGLSTRLATAFDMEKHINVYHSDRETKIVCDRTAERHEILLDKLIECARIDNSPQEKEKPKRRSAGRGRGILEDSQAEWPPLGGKLASRSAPQPPISQEVPRSPSPVYVVVDEISEDYCSSTKAKPGSELQEHARSASPESGDETDSEDEDIYRHVYGLGAGKSFDGGAAGGSGSARLPSFLSSCYHCGESGHMSRDCPTTDACTHCNSRQHDSEDCPDKPSRHRFGLGCYCYRCGSHEHRSLACPKKAEPPPPPQPYCVQCDQLGHSTINCPNVTCTDCYRRGHRAEKCPFPKPGSAKAAAQDRFEELKICFICDKEGHTSNECPQEEHASAVCDACGKEGHMAVHCKET